MGCERSGAGAAEVPARQRCSCEAVSCAATAVGTEGGGGRRAGWWAVVCLYFAAGAPICVRRRGPLWGAEAGTQRCPWSCLRPWAAPGDGYGNGHETRHGRARQKEWHAEMETSASNEAGAAARHTKGRGSTYARPKGGGVRRPPPPGRRYRWARTSAHRVRERGSGREPCSGEGRGNGGAMPRVLPVAPACGTYTRTCAAGATEGGGRFLTATDGGARIGAGSATESGRRRGCYSIGTLLSQLRWAAIVGGGGGRGRGLARQRGAGSCWDAGLGEGGGDRRARGGAPSPYYRVVYCCVNGAGKRVRETCVRPTSAANTSGANRAAPAASAAPAAPARGGAEAAAARPPWPAVPPAAAARAAGARAASACSG